ncbi:MAG: tRNA (cytosine(32)/uridine(32)-2'-O)-methyltransferase TrmJ, partial [Pseudomonadales bacterium]|nr:tRNA (cytosine(32)/uridine(32)-2'-O)-methyltransferase TrmJ [Pseudomonadales bacterium]
MSDANLFPGVRVILVETTHPGNIGAAARAMKNMGLTELVLVNPYNFPNEKAVYRSASAEDVVQS